MLLLGTSASWAQERVTEYEYITLPYALDALEPAISRRTMALHYGEHLRSYVENLNRLIKGIFNLFIIVIYYLSFIFRSRKITITHTKCAFHIAKQYFTCVGTFHVA